MNLLRLLVSLAVVALLVAWLATALCAVPPGEVVVVRRLGQPLTPAWGPGLHLGWPAPFEQRDRLRLDQIRRLAVGPLVDAGESMGDLGEFLTADHNLLVARAAVQYRIRDPFAFLLTSSDPDRALSRLAESALVAALAGFPAEILLRDGRSAAEAALRNRLASDADRFALGLEILSVQLETLRPPPEVAADFAAAQAASTDRQRRVREAEIEAERRLADAQARAAAQLDSARARAADRLAEAQARAARFRAVLASYQPQPSLTRRRLYLETLTDILRSLRRKLILPPDAPIDLGLSTPD